MLRWIYFSIGLTKRNYKKQHRSSKSSGNYIHNQRYVHSIASIPTALKSAKPQGGIVLTHSTIPPQLTIK